MIKKIKIFFNLKKVLQLYKVIFIYIYKVIYL